MPGVRCTTTVTVIAVTAAVLEKVSRFSRYQGGLPPVVTDTVTPPLPLGMVSNVAVTVRACVIDTVQPPVPVHAPLHPANVDPPAAAAVSVTLVPLAKLAFWVAQVVPQLMPAGLDVTVPAPVPALFTGSVWLLLLVSNVAVTVRACVIDTVHPPVPVQAPLHPANVDPLAAVAVSVTLVPFAKDALCVLQPAPQLIPAGLDVTVPAPVPALFTVSVWLVLVVLKVAVTVRA